MKNKINEKQKKRCMHALVEVVNSLFTYRLASLLLASRNQQHKTVTAWHCTTLYMDYLNKNSMKTSVATDEGNSGNEM